MSAESFHPSGFSHHIICQFGTRFFVYSDGINVSSSHTCQSILFIIFVSCASISSLDIPDQKFRSSHHNSYSALMVLYFVFIAKNQNTRNNIMSFRIFFVDLLAIWYCSVGKQYIFFV